MIHPPCINSRLQGAPSAIRHGCRRALPARLLYWVTAVLLCAPLAAVQAGNDKPSSAQDLQYGEALFHYFQQDWFNSIVRLQIADTQQALPNHADEAELLLGGLDLSYGLRDEASRIFERLLTDASRDDLTRNRAWYYLAKISYQRNDPVAAMKALAQVDGNMTRATRAESALLGSLLLLQLGRNAEAIEIIEAARAAGSWTPYLAYNLGVAQIRSGKLEQGAGTFDELGEMSGRSEELRLLRDKANLALGYSYLQSGDAMKSRATLERVRLQGPLSSKALLGTGWADADAERFGQALVPWSELGKRNATDPAVQEALLASSYAMTRMNLHGRAVDQYNSAIAALHDEKGKLDESISAIKNGELLNILEQQDLRSGSGWLQQLTMDTRSPALRYQVTLMAAHEFQEAVKNYRDLLVLHNNLETWADSIDAYDDMLAARRQRFADNRPAAERALRASDHAELQRRHAQLASRLQQIESEEDAVGLADETETRQWHRLQAIKARLAGLPRQAGTDALRDKQARLEGVLRWQLHSQYKPRLWQAKRSLAELEQLLGESQLALNNLRDSRSNTPEGFSAFGRRIADQRKTIHALLERTRDIQLAQGEAIEQLAINELEQQQKRIDIYIVQARFSLAQTYDSALQVKRGAPQ